MLLVTAVSSVCKLRVTLAAFEALKSLIFVDELDRDLRDPSTNIAGEHYLLLRAILLPFCAMF